MKIAIDVQTTMGRPTGFGFYVSSLVENLKKIQSGHKYLLVEPDSEKDFSTPKRFFWDQLTYPIVAKKHGADLLHQPCFSAPFLFKGPVVITIHDLISMLFPENIPFASRMFYSKWMPITYRKATKIITVSASTKNDIVRILDIPAEKITVIPLAVEDKFKKPLTKSEVESVKDKYQIKSDYILHVGTLEPRKNLHFLISVFAKLIRDEANDNLNLVIVGKKGWYFEGLFELVKESGLKDRVIFTGYVDDEDKPAIYQGAKMFAFPSLYEGFGLPPLEAMASGVPVISSNTSSMPEVIGEAGILIDPKDEKKWIEAITRVNTDEPKRKSMIEANKVQVAKFDWSKTAQKTIDIYEQAYREYYAKTKTPNN